MRRLPGLEKKRWRQFAELLIKLATSASFSTAEALAMARLATRGQWSKNVKRQSASESPA
jgi:hypothetical protein